MCKSQTLGVMREFKTKNFEVVADAIEEDDIDLSWDETGKVKRELMSGELIVFCARVRVFFKGQEIASDYLGNCIYRSIVEFMDHKEVGKQNRKWAKQGREGRCGSYFRDMIKQAITEARKHMLQFKSITVRG